MTLNRKRQIGNQPRGVDRTRLRRAEDGLLDEKQFGQYVTLDRRNRLTLDIEALRRVLFPEEVVTTGTDQNTTGSGIITSTSSGGGGIIPPAEGGTDIDRLWEIPDCAQLALATNGQVPTWSAANTRWEAGTVVSSSSGIIDGGDANSPSGTDGIIDGGGA